MTTAIADVQTAHPAAQVVVSAEDEHRLGLKPVLRRVWTLPGVRPLARVWPRYQWCYVVAFVQPETGQTFWLLLPRINTALFNQALTIFAEAVGAGAELRVVLVVDQASWHRSAALVVPEGVHLVYLPAYSPELQPAERVWGLVDEVVANRVIPSLDELFDVLSERCRTLHEQTSEIAARTCFHGWPHSTSWSPK